MEKLELHVHEYTIKVEELNRTIIDITSHKTRVVQVKFLFLERPIIKDLLIQRSKLWIHNDQENIELTKEVQELKVNYENISYLKNQISSQFEDLRRRFEDEERVRISTKRII